MSYLTNKKKEKKEKSNETKLIKIKITDPHIINMNPNLVRMSIKSMFYKILSYWHINFFLHKIQHILPYLIIFQYTPSWIGL